MIPDDPHWFRLDAQNLPVPADVYDDFGEIDPIKLTAFDRELALTRVLRITMVGPLRASTVFLGIDLSFQRGGSAICFETMVFNDGTPKVATLLSRPEKTVRFSPTLEEMSRRHKTYEGALTYHEALIQRLAREWGDVKDVTAETLEALRRHHEG